MEENRPSITLRLEPENETCAAPRPKTVSQLLGRLGLRPSACLVIRDEDGLRSLLTPDRKIEPGDVITVRKVTSSG